MGVNGFLKIWLSLSILFPEKCSFAFSPKSLSNFRETMGPRLRPPRIVSLSIIFTPLFFCMIFRRKQCNARNNGRGFYRSLKFYYCEYNLPGIPPFVSGFHLHSSLILQHGWHLKNKGWVIEHCKFLTSALVYFSEYILK